VNGDNLAIFISISPDMPSASEVIFWSIKHESAKIFRHLCLPVKFLSLLFYTTKQNKSKYCTVITRTLRNQNSLLSAYSGNNL